MKKRCKYTLLIMLYILFCVLVGGGITVYASNDGENVGGYDNIFGATLNSFEMYDNGLIREVSPKGLRFETGISYDDKAKIEVIADKNSIQFGTLVTLDKYLEDKNVDLTFESVSNIKYIDVEIINWLTTTQSVFGEGYTGYYTTLVGGTGSDIANLKDLDEARYNDLFVARSYVKYRVDGEEQIIYAKNTMSRSIANAAERAVAFGDSSKFIKGIVSSAKAQKSLSIVYNTNGGNEIYDKEVVVGHILDTYDIPEKPTKEHHEFLGWYKDSALTTPFEFSGILSEDTIIYAKWSKVITTFTDLEFNASKTMNLPIIDVEAGEYVVIDFTLNARTIDSATTFPKAKLLGNVNNASDNSFIYFNENNNLIPERLVKETGKRYAAVLEITDVDKDSVYKILDSSANLNVNQVKIYSKETFKNELLNYKASDEQINETEYFLVKNGNSNYKLVLPNSPKKYETEAANDIKKYIYQATGINLAITSESYVNFKSNSKLIVLGNTDIAKNNGVTVSENIPRGFKIKQIDSNIIIAGGSDMGTLCGAYEFLSHQFGFEAYALDYTHIETGVTTKKLLAFNLTDEPDVDWTHGYHHQQYRDGALTMRYNYYDAMFLPPSYADENNSNWQAWHNTFAYISPEYYYATNPDWFVMSGGRAVQLNYLATSKYDGKTMTEIIYEKMVGYIDVSFAAGKYFDYIGFVHEDNTSFVSDSSTEPYKQAYGDGYRAAILIKFINPLAEMINAYVSNKYDREINIVISAYISTIQAPVKDAKENGKWVPIDNSVIPNKNVCVMIADMAHDYVKTYKTTKSQKVEQWQDLLSINGSKQMYWVYDYYTAIPLLYYDNTYNLKNIISLSNGCAMVFNEALQPHELGSFVALKTYLTSKFSWDNTLDIHELIDNFFDCYYGVASENMWKAYDCMLTQIGPSQGTAGNLPGGNPSFYASRNIWTKEFLEEFKGYIDKAYIDIAQLKDTNPILYKQLWERITRESLMARFLLMDLYNVNVTSKTKQAFIDDCTALGITSVSPYLAPPVKQGNVVVKNGVQVLMEKVPGAIDAYIKTA